MTSDVRRVARHLGWNPAVAVWEMTRGRDRSPATITGAPRELGTSEALVLLAQLRELDPGLVVLAGDDLCERPDLEELVDVAVASGLRVAVTPGVTPLLTAERIRRLAALGVCRIALGLDGPDAPTHDRMQGRAGSFDATRAAIAAVRRVGLPLQLSTRLTLDTVVHLVRTAELVAELAPWRWNVSFVVPGEGACGPRQLGPDSCERVFHFLYEWGRLHAQAVSTTAAPAFRRVVLQREAAHGDARTRRPLPASINDGRGLVFVSHAGDIRPSGLLPLSTANVREAHVAAVYRRSRLFRALRDPSRLQGRCGRCGFRTVCGGSRARAYAATGSFLAEDPACGYVPGAAQRPRGSGH